MFLYLSTGEMVWNLTILRW